MRTRNTAKWRAHLRIDAFGLSHIFLVKAYANARTQYESLFWAKVDSVQHMEMVNAQFLEVVYRVTHPYFRVSSPSGSIFRTRRLKRCTLSCSRASCVCPGACTARQGQNGDFDFDRQGVMLCNGACTKAIVEMADGRDQLGGTLHCSAKTLLKYHSPEVARVSTLRHHSFDRKVGELNNVVHHLLHTPSTNVFCEPLVDQLYC